MERMLDISIEKIQRKLIKMASMVDENVDDVILNITQNKSDLLERIEENSKKVVKLNDKLQKNVLKLLALNQPVAQDLRIALSAIKISSSLKRMAQLTKKIGKISNDFNYPDKMLEEIQFEEICIITNRMIKNAIDAFINNDLQLANIVYGQEDKLDRIVWENSNNVIQLAKSDMNITEKAISLFQILQELERLGDYSTYIIDEIHFLNNNS